MKITGFGSVPEFFDMGLKNFEATTGSLVEMLDLGPARENSEKFLEVFSTFFNLYIDWMDSNSNFQSRLLEAMLQVHKDTERGCEIEGEINPGKYKYFYRICNETYKETLEKRSLNNQVRIGSGLILGTPHERVKLLKAGADGKLIEKLYVDCNNFKKVSGHVLIN